MLQPILITLMALSFALTAHAAPLPYPAATTASAPLAVPSAPQAETLPQAETEAALQPSTVEKLKEVIGVTYFSYFFGPGLHPDKTAYNPNQLGLPQNDGMYFQNHLSFRYKFSPTIALDFQTRFNIFINNANPNSDFTLARWETPRIGISGKLMSGKDWTLAGAVNTDFPYFLPAPFTGYQSQLRKVLFTPGMFATFKYNPKESPWSIFSVVTPRYFFYEDLNAAEPQLMKAGMTPQNKPEFIIAFQPTVNYRLSSQVQLSLGTSIDYRKHVISSWNIFDASLVTNGDSTAWRLNALPINFGVTYEISPHFTVFPFITTYPIAAQRVHAKSGQQASLMETTSVAMWIYGTIF